MNNLVELNNKQVVTTSLQVAETFNKEHKNVIQSIENLTVQNSVVKSMFEKSSYTNERNREYPMYHMTKEGFLLLTASYRGKDVLEKKLKVLEKTGMIPPSLPERKEVKFMEMLGEALEPWGLVVEKQKKVNNFYLDGYIESLNLAIEYDENHHKFNVERDNKRQKEIEKKMNCYFVRVSDDKSHAYNIGLVLKEVAKLTVQKWTVDGKGENE